MRTPSDQRIEERLDLLVPDGHGEAPEAFLCAVRTRRAVVRRRRAAAVGVCAVCGMTLAGAVLSLPRPARVIAPPIEPTPRLVAAAQLEEDSMLALRRAWGRQDDPVVSLASFPADTREPEAEPPLRVGDAARFLPEGL